MYSRRETWKKCVISYTGALKKNLPQLLHTKVCAYLCIYIPQAVIHTHRLLACARVCVWVCIYIVSFVLSLLLYLNTPRMYYTAQPTSPPLKCFYCSLLFPSCHTIIWFQTFVDHWRYLVYPLHINTRTHTTNLSRNTIL